MELMETVKKTGRAIEKAFTPSAEKNQDRDVLDTLKQEHDEVQDLLKQLVDCKSGPQSKALVRKIRMALVPHTRAEEKVVYDAIIAIRDKGAQKDGEEGYYEHGLADKMLGTLAKITNATSPEFMAAAKVLKELIDHHVAEEERNVWKDVREHFDGDQRIEMNRRFEAAKKKVRV